MHLHLAVTCEGLVRLQARHTEEMCPGDKHLSAAELAKCLKGAGSSHDTFDLVCNQTARVYILRIDAVKATHLIGEEEEGKGAVGHSHEQAIGRGGNHLMHHGGQGSCQTGPCAHLHQSLHEALANSFPYTLQPIHPQLTCSHLNKQGRQSDHKSIHPVC